MAVGFYVAKYVNKKSDMDLAAKGLGAKEWNNSLKTKLSLLPKKLFRIRMSHNFGMKMLTMTNLSTECLIQLTKLGYDATPFNQILKQNAKREMRLRLGKVTVADRSEERFSRNAETDLVCRLLLEKKKTQRAGRDTSKRKQALAADRHTRSHPRPNSRTPMAR